jgi:hypothetical protein
MHAMGSIITTFLFMLLSVQIHEMRPLAVKSLKALTRSATASSPTSISHAAISLTP